MLQRSGGIVSAALSQPDPAAALRADAAAPLRNFAKDLDYVLQAAKGVGLSLPASAAARAAVRRAEGMGVDGADWAHVSEMHACEMHASSPLLKLPSYPPSHPPHASPPAPLPTLASLHASVPPPRSDELKLRMRCAVMAAKRGTPLAVIDDDPTGTQSDETPDPNLTPT